MKTTLLEEDKIAVMIRQIPSRSFTMLDFNEVFTTLYPADWQRLVARFGQLDEKRRLPAAVQPGSRIIAEPRMKNANVLAVRGSPS